MSEGNENSNNNNDAAADTAGSGGGGGGTGMFANTANSFKMFMNRTANASKNIAENTKTSSRNFFATTKASSQRVLDKTGNVGKQMVEKSVQQSRRSVGNLKQAVDKQAESLKHVVDNQVSSSKSAWEKTMQAVDKQMLGTKSAVEKTLQQWGVVQVKPPDTLADTLEEGLEKLTLMIDTVQPPDIKWELQMTPFLDGATHQDIYRAFLQWSREEHQVVVEADKAEETDASKEQEEKKDTGSQESSSDAPADTPSTTTDASSDGDKKDQSEEPPKPTVAKIMYNVTKAFSRLESYVNWMEAHRSDLAEPKLTAESVKEASKAWAIECRHDKQGRFIWFFDFSKMDIKAIQKNGGTIPLRDSLRYIVWASHVMLFDKHAQDNGMVVVQSMGYMGIMESMNMVPLDMAALLDKFTMGTLPVKLKQIYVFNSARWVGMIMGFMKPFLAQKMRQRIVLLDDKKTRKSIGMDPLAFLEQELGSECIPEAFGCFGGGVADGIPASPATAESTPAAEPTVPATSDAAAGTDTPATDAPKPGE